MSPHIEERTGSFRFPTGTRMEEITDPLPGTSHMSGDMTSANSKLAHFILGAYPDKFVEVGDEKGPACNEYQPTDRPVALSVESADLIELEDRPDSLPENGSSDFRLWAGV